MFGKRTIWFNLLAAPRPVGPAPIMRTSTELEQSQLSFARLEEDTGYKTNISGMVDDLFGMRGIRLFALQTPLADGQLGGTGRKEQQYSVLCTDQLSGCVPLAGSEKASNLIRHRRTWVQGEECSGVIGDSC